MPTPLATTTSNPGFAVPPPEAGSAAPQSTSPRILAERGNVVKTLLGRIFKRKDAKKDTDPPNAHSSEAGDITYPSCMGSIFKRKGTGKTALESVPDTSPTLQNPAGDNRETEGPSTFQVAMSARNFEEIQNPAENTTQHTDTELTSEAPEPTTSVKDSIVPNLTTILNVVQQVGKILQSVPFVEPVGAILAEAVTVYKEVEDNSGKQDTLSKQVNTLNKHLEKARLRLEELDRTEPGGSVGLASDVNAYMEKLKDVKQRLTEAAERSWFNQTVQRGAIAAELDSIDKNLRLFRDMFMEDRLITIEAKLNRMARHIAETHVAVLKSITDAERKEIIEWLSPINFFTRQADILRRRQPGTGEWILAVEEFKRWKTGCPRILWGRGIPGAGKTVVASVVVDHLTKHAENNNIGVACMYLNHKETDAQTPFNLLAAVWRQLVWSKPIASDYKVQRLFQAYSEKRTKPDLTEIHEILRSVVAQWNRVYIVIDALDETPDNNRQTLLDYLANLGPTVCLMLTSRHDVALQNINAEILEIRVPEVDIQTYVKEKINESRRLTSVLERNLELRDDIASKVQSSADRMFLLARLHVESFETCSTISDIRDTLDNLSENLEAAYGKVMERIGAQSERDKKLADLILMWVSNAKRPLSVEELREALAVERGAKSLNPEKHQPLAIILSVCAGLVIVDQESTTVRLVHFTTHDYLDGRFPYAHTQIAHTLFTYMVFDKIENLLGDVEDPDVELADLESRMKEADAQHALLPYCYYCFVHATGEPEEELRDMILDSLSRAGEWRVLSNWCQWKVPDPWNDYGWPESPSPLWVATAANLYRTVKYLLDCGTSPNNLSPQLENGSPLCAASEYNHIRIVELLLKRGADIHAGDDDALQRAAGAGNLEVVNLLLEKGADIHAGDDAALQAATESSKLEVMQLLLEKGADIHARDDAVLRTAAHWGELDTVRFLLLNGADIHARDDAALQEAARWGKLEVMRLLLEKGADIHAGDDAALQGAIHMDELGVVQLLLENGANIHAKDNAALQRAVRRGQFEIVQLLLENGASTHAGEDAALREAARRGWLEIVRLLLENEADIHAGNDAALRKAHEAGHIEVFQLLLEHDADPNALQIQPEWQNIETESQTPLS
ncbi:hypothetical protein C8R43DRAFT_1197445 [Mycena crocata]|nr:hypothetical protein C8R43DRAFT_1197445 [Mycena crocata]